MAIAHTEFGDKKAGTLNFVPAVSLLMRFEEG
jgi:hypothetical protein